MSVPEWKKYKPITVQVTPSPLSKNLYGYIATTPPPKYKRVVYDPVRLPSKPLGMGAVLRSRMKTTAPTVYGVTDANTGGGGFIDRTAFFKAGKYPTYDGLPEYYQSKVHELPSREQFVSEGGVFGEPLISGGEGITEEGLFGEAKGFNLEWILILGGVLLLCLLIFAL